MHEITMTFNKYKKVVKLIYPYHCNFFYYPYMHVYLFKLP